MRKIYLLFVLCCSISQHIRAQYGPCTTIDYIHSQYLMSAGLFGFGGSQIVISADGNTLAVGNRDDRRNGTGVNPPRTGNITEAGAVFVYSRTDSLSPWVFQAYIKASNTGVSDNFSISLSLSADGNTLAVGAYAEDGSGTGINPPSDNLASNAGAAYIYTRSGSTWSFTDYIKAPNTNALDGFGYSVSLSGDGNTLAVGAFQEYGSGTGINPPDDNLAPGAGAAYIYTRSGSTWSFSDYIKASNTGAGDGFGRCVVLSSDGSRLAVAAENEDGSGTGVNPTSDELASDAGAVYTYVRSAGVWTFQAYIKASNTESNDRFGADAISLNADGSTLAVTASSEDGSGTGINPTSDNLATDAGAVYIYTRSGSTWSFSDYIKASNTDASDAFGRSISLSADGNTLAVGASSEDGSRTGINPTSDNASSSSGAAYLFKRTAGVWAQNAYIKAPISVSNDRLGRSISLSANGQNLAVGAPGDQSSGLGVNPVKSNSGTIYGAVWVYNQFGATIARKSDTGVISKANVCTDPLYIHLKDTADKSARRNIARIFKNGNTFSVDSAFVDASNAGTYLASGVGQSTKLMRRMLSIHTTPATGLTVNGGPIVRFYYDTTERNTELPTATYAIQRWFKHPYNKDSTLAHLVFNNLDSSVNLTPVASGFDSGVAFVDLQVTSFSTFGALGSTGTLLPLHLLQFEAKPNTDCGVDVRWTTANEKDIHRFVVQGSSNGKDWEEKGIVKPSNSNAAQHQYQYQDLLSLSGNYYYRLMYEEYQGYKMYSPVSALHMNCASNSPKLYPTLTHNTVSVWLPEAYADATITVLNLGGQLQELSQEANGAYRTLHFAALPQDLYFVRITHSDGHTMHLKVMKQ